MVPTCKGEDWLKGASSREKGEAINRFTSAVVMFLLLSFTGCSDKENTQPKYSPEEAKEIRSRILHEEMEKLFKEKYGHPMEVGSPDLERDEQGWLKPPDEEAMKEVFKRVDNVTEFVDETGDPRTETYQELKRRLEKAYEEHGVAPE